MQNQDQEYRALHVGAAIWRRVKKITDGEHTRWEFGEHCDRDEQYKLFTGMPHRQPFASYGGYDIYRIDPITASVSAFVGGQLIEAQGEGSDHQTAKQAAERSVQLQAHCGGPTH